LRYRSYESVCTAASLSHEDLKKYPAPTLGTEFAQVFLHSRYFQQCFRSTADLSGDEKTVPIAIPHNTKVFARQFSGTSKLLCFITVFDVQWLELQFF
jgi:hypothetical protein